MGNFAHELKLKLTVGDFFCKILQYYQVSGNPEWGRFIHWTGRTLTSYLPIIYIFYQNCILLDSEVVGSCWVASLCTAGATQDFIGH